MQLVVILSLTNAALSTDTFTIAPSLSVLGVFGFRLPESLTKTRLLYRISLCAPDEAPIAG